MNIPEIEEKKMEWWDFEKKNIYNKCGKNMK